MDIDLLAKIILGDDNKKKKKLLKKNETEIIRLSQNQIYLSYLFDTCITARDLSTLEYLIDILDVNLYINKYNNSLLNEILIRNLNHSVIFILLQKTNYILKTNIFNRNIIFICITTNRVKILSELVEKDNIKCYIEENEFEILKYCIYFARKTILDIILSLGFPYTLEKMLLIYSYFNDKLKIKQMIARYQLKCLRDKQNHTFLTFLLKNKEFDFIEEIINYLQEIDFGSFSSLYNKVDDIIMFKWIFYSSKYNISLLIEKNVQGNTPFIECILNNDLLFCDIFLCNSNLILEKNIFGHDALYICTILNKYQLCQKILSRVNDPFLHEKLLVAYILKRDTLFALLLRYLKKEFNLNYFIQQEKLDIHTNLIEQFVIHKLKIKTVKQIEKTYLLKKIYIIHEILFRTLNDDCIHLILKFIGYL